MSDVPHAGGVAFHIVNGRFVFPYTIDARNAVARFPGEWSGEPWSHAASKAFAEPDRLKSEPMIPTMKSPNLGDPQ